MARRSKSFRRRRAFRNPKPRLAIVCEGKITEPDYFYNLAQSCGALVAVDLVLESGAGVPMSVANKAIELLPKTRGIHADSFSRNDRVWAVFDRDEHPHFDDAIQKAEAAGVFIAYSNPCFELWIILHFADWDRPTHRRDVQRALRDLLPSYDPNGSKKVDFARVANEVPAAVKRAKIICKKREEERQARGNPSTTVFRLVEAIVSNGKR